jgi:autotransporter-associated beta strand protein
MKTIMQITIHQMAGVLRCIAATLALGVIAALTGLPTMAKAADINKTASFTGSATEFVGNGGNYGNNNRLQIGLSATGQTFILNSGTLTDGAVSTQMISMNILGTGNTFTLTGSSTQVIITNVRNWESGGTANGSFHLWGTGNTMNVIAGATFTANGWNGLDGSGNTLHVDGVGSIASFSANGGDGFGNSSGADQYTTNRVSITNGGAVYTSGTGLRNFVANAGTGNYAVSVDGTGGRSVLGVSGISRNGPSSGGIARIFNGGALETHGSNPNQFNGRIDSGQFQKVFIDGGVISYKDATGARIDESTAGEAAYFTYAGNNAMRLNNSAATDTGSYILANNLGSKNYTRLEMISGTTSVARSITIDGAHGGSMLFDGTNATIANGVTLTGTATLTATGAPSTLTGVIAGAGSLTKYGTGTLALNSANTYSGNTTINQGTLSITHAYLADSSTVTIASGAQLDLDTAGASDTITALVLGGAPVPAGTYNATHATYGSYFTGSGSLVVPNGTPLTTTTTLALTTGTNPSDFGDVVTFTATVTGATPTGNVTFHNGVTPLGVGTLDAASQASITISSLTAGEHTITAWYNGDTNNAPSAAATPHVQVVIYAKKILSFMFPGLPQPLLAGTNINVIVPYGTDVTALAPIYSVSTLASGNPASGIARNFLTPQTYIITAQGGSTNNYVVTVTVAQPSGMVTMDYVTIGDAGNVADTTGYGAVAYAYNIGKFEVTNSQYAAFLNAADPDGINPYGIYISDMGSDARGGISFTSGAASGAKYAVRTYMGDKPVNYISWFDAARFCNWMHNGQGSGSTETGAYTLNGATSGIVLQEPVAKVWIPTENEWYKAAYYDPALPGYWEYPTRNNTVPTTATADAIGNVANPGTDVANYAYGADWNGQNGNLTSVGSAGAASASAYDTYDQAGNAWEWNDAVDGTWRGRRGGSFSSYVSGGINLHSSYRQTLDPASAFSGSGFRVASVPQTPPVITLQPLASQTVARLASVTLTAEADGLPAPTFQWYLGMSGDTANPLAGATTGTYTTPALTEDANYWVRATNSAGSADSYTAAIHVISSNASLAGLTLSAGSLSPTFATGISHYSASVPNATDSITLSPLAADPNASVTVNGIPVVTTPAYNPSGLDLENNVYSAMTTGPSSAPISLQEGFNTITIVVTAEDGLSTQTYTLDVTRCGLLLVTTQGVSGLTSTAAVLHGTVNPHGNAMACFEYGLTTDYGNKTTPQEVSGAEPINLEATLNRLMGGTVYHYRLVTYNAGETIFGSDMAFTTPAEPPLVVTGNPVGVSGSGATLLGVVNPNGVPVQVRFIYGLTTLYGNFTPMRNIPAGSNLLNVLEPITGLVTGATYHYCIIATTAAGTIQGSDVSFVATSGGSGTGLPTAVPSVTTNGSSAVDMQSAELSGTVNPHDGTTVVRFEYGMTSSYGQTTVQQGVGNGNTPLAVTMLVEGLLPGTHYHFRMLGSNSLGTAAGADAEFTTAVAAPTVVTGIANILTTTSASVTGSVRAHGLDAQVFIDYGTSATAMSNSITAVPSTVTGDTTTAVSADLTGLSQGTTYYYQVRAVNAGGTARGGIRSFDVGALSGLSHWFPDPVVAADRQGVVTVNLTPLNIGGGWRFAGERDWRASGSASGLTAGTRVVEYRKLPGYLPVPDETITVTSSTVPTVLERTYTVAGVTGSGNLTVTLQPASLTGAQWRFFGAAEWRDSGTPVTDLAPGDYVIECKAVSGRTTPPPATASVTDGHTTLATITYVMAESTSATPPTVLTFDMISGQQDMPYAYVGQITSDVGSSTGFVVRPRVVATAGHVVFDDVTLAATTGLQWYFQLDRGVHEPLALTPRGYYLLSGYADQRAAENTPGESTPQSQNLDAAALYFLDDAGRGGYSGYFASDSASNEFLVSHAMKTLVGYPVEEFDVNNPIEQGKMYATLPHDVTFVQALEFGQTYSTAQIRSSGGNSGGPLCVRHASGIYYPAAIYLGGTSQLVVRAIDSAVVALFQSAADSATSGAGITITSPEWVDCIHGQPLGYQISATNSPTGFTLQGSLPDGLVFHATSGLIDGTPQVAGIFTVSVGAYNTGGSSTQNVTFRCLPVLDPQSVTVIVLQPLSYSIMSSESGNGVVYTAANLPPGFALDSSTGVISGIATYPGVFQVPISVARNGAMATSTITLNVIHPVPVFSLQPVAYKTVQYGMETTLTALASISMTANTTLLYQWYEGLSGNISNPVTGATLPTFTTPPITMDTTYWVRASSDSSGTSADSTATTITVASSANANLANLTPSQGALSPAFNADIISYTLTVPYATTAITLTPEVQSDQSTVAINGAAVVPLSASDPINLAVGTNIITSVVTAGDLTTTRTYTITVTRVQPPVVTTEAASSVTGFSATLNGSVVPNGTVSAYFKYVVPGDTTIRVTPVQILSGSTAQPVQASLSGLSAIGLYNYQLVVVSGTADLYGGNMTFTISRMPLVATGTPIVTAITGNTYNVTLVGTANPLGQPINVHFEIGDTPDCSSITTTQNIPAVTSLVDVFANNAFADITPPINLVAGATYYYRMVADGFAGGPVYGSTVSFQMTAGTGGVAPAVVTGDTSDLTVSSVNLHGQVNPNGNNTSVYFEYGLDTSYGSTTPPVDKGNVSSMLSVMQSAAGLLPGTTYHFRCVAANGNGRATGVDNTFTTTALLPLAITGTAEVLTPTGARLHASVRARGAATTVDFEYGTDGRTFPYVITAMESPVTGDIMTPVSVDLTGLTSSTKYYYRVRASNSGGTVDGAVATLQTNLLLGFMQRSARAVVGIDYQGQVQVILQPSGGGWRFVGETQWRDSGTTAVGLTTGDRQIEYQPLAGRIQPPSETVGVVSGDPLLVLERYYYESAVVGDLRVILKPDAIADGNVPEAERAQWRMLGDISAEWRNSGDAITGIWPGSYVVECKGIPGFATPPPMPVMVQAGKTSMAMITYSDQGGTPQPVLDYSLGTVGIGNLSVLLQPAAAVANGAQWRLAGDSGASWINSGESMTGILPGSYLVECKPVTGRTTPTPIKVRVLAGQTTATTITYFTAMDTTVNLQPVSFATASTRQDLPYAYVGMLRSGTGGSYSGFVVKPQVVATVAQAVFDEATLTATADLQWLLQRDQNQFEPTPQIPRGFYAFTGYAEQRDAEQKAPGGAPGTLSNVSLNLNVAALYFSQIAGRGGFSGFLAPATTSVTANEFLESSSMKTLVGYPANGITPDNQGRMHATAPLPAAFAPLHDLMQIYTTSYIQGVDGMLGGPLCVQYEGGTYYPAGVYVGGATGSTVRAIDSETVSLFASAESSANGGFNDTGGGITHSSFSTIGSPEDPGALKVIIEPEAARTAGAGWRLSPEVTYRASGAQKYGLAPGFYVLQLITVSGFQEPATQSVEVTGGQLREVTFTYLEEYTALELWRLANFGTTDNSGTAADSADPDGDGCRNIDEYTVATDPNNTADVFKILTASKTPTTFTVTANGKAAHTYVLERTTNLAAGPWTAIDSASPLVNETVTLSDSSLPAISGFYRLRVSPP